MIVAMATVGVVQVAIYEIVDMIAVGHGLVSASGPMRVRCVVASALVSRRAS